MMGEYLPFRGKHAVQEVQVDLVFPGRLDRTSIDTARGVARAELQTDFPQLFEVHEATLQVNVSNPASPTHMGEAAEVVGFQLMRMQGNGQPGRVLRLTNNLLSVSVMDYESWEKDGQSVLRYFKTIVPGLRLSQNPVIGFGLRFIDRFTYNGHPDEARAEFLFVRTNPYLTAQALDSGGVWHCNTGWFEDALPNRVLHNLNVASNVIDLAPTVTIDHQATVHLTTARQSLESLFDQPPRDDECVLMEGLNCLHDRNKGILKEMLVKDMIERIGLDS